jgi:hypothetical protein
MEGSITQLNLSNYLNANGNQNAVSFFRHSYRNYSNFVKDSREVYFKNGIDFGKTASFRFDEDGKYGDLITNIVVSIDLPDISNIKNINGHGIGYCNGIGNAIFQNIILRLNGNIIDQHTSEFLNIYGDLTVKAGCKENYYNMIQQYDDNTYSFNSFQGGRIYIPLQFWFCRNITTRNSSLVFPLLNFYNSTIELSLDVRSFKNLIVAEDGILTGISDLNILGGSLFIDYVILDDIERKQYLDIPKQLNIINQMQYYQYNIEGGAMESTFSLKRMHYLVSEIFFVVRSNIAEIQNNYFNYSKTLSLSNKQNPIKSVRLIYDGRDRIKKTAASVFTDLEPTKVHTNTPINRFIHVYSFALEPEKIEQPNGLMNFSEIQEPLLHLEFNTGITASTLFVYAVNYNVLIASKGTGWLLHHLSKSIPTVFPSVSCDITIPS